MQILLALGIGQFTRDARLRNLHQLVEIDLEYARRAIAAAADEPRSIWTEVDIVDRGRVISQG